MEFFDDLLKVMCLYCQMNVPLRDKYVDLRQKNSVCV